MFWVMQQSDTGPELSWEISVEVIPDPKLIFLTRIRTWIWTNLQKQVLGFVFVLNSSSEEGGGSVRAVSVYCGSVT